MSGFFASALLLFTLRLVDVTLYTIRIMMVVRGRKGLAWLFGFFQAIIYVIALQRVLSDLGDWPKILGYAAGFATGMVVGMWVEERLALGYTHIRVISSRRGSELSGRLRDEGCAVTEVSGYGKDGTVTILNTSVQRKDTLRVEKLIAEADPSAFITAESVRSVRHGFWGG